MNLIGRIKRELVVFFSKTCIKKTRNNYLGLDLVYPIVYGMGRGYVIPKEIWMGQCLGVFINTKDGCVIDVGSNVGVYLVKLRVHSEDVPYYGFEPNAICNFYTNELIRLNCFKSSVVLPLALSDNYSVHKLYASKLGDKGASLVRSEVRQGDNNFSSMVYTVPGSEILEQLDIKEVAVVKIDVEGAELSVLKGLEAAIKKFRPYMYVEIWGDNLGDNMDGIRSRVEWVLELLRDTDYYLLAVNKKSRLEIVDSIDGFLKIDDPNFIFVPTELLNEFIRNIQSTAGCEVSVDDSIFT